MCLRRHLMRLSGEATQETVWFQMEVDALYTAPRKVAISCDVSLN